MQHDLTNDPRAPQRRGPVAAVPGKPWGLRPWSQYAHPEGARHRVREWSHPTFAESYFLQTWRDPSGRIRVELVGGTSPASAWIAADPETRPAYGPTDVAAGRVYCARRGEPALYRSGFAGEDFRAFVAELAGPARWSALESEGVA